MQTVRAIHNAGIPIGVVSSAVYHPFLEWTLEKFGISDAIQVIVTSASAGFYKSRPEIYWHAAELIGAAPSRMVHVGDSLRFDVGGAARAGFGTVWLQREGAEPTSDAPLPDLTVRTLLNSAAGIIGVLETRQSCRGPIRCLIPKLKRAPAVRFDIFSLFPGIFTGPLSESIVKRGQERGLVEIGLHDIRDWADDRHRTVDDTPYGGGAGMVLKAPPVVSAVEAILQGSLADTRILAMSAGGRLFTQSMAEELARQPRIAIVCGRYEGIDERAIDILGAESVSVGDFVLTGGELPAAVIVDAVTRLIPGVIDAASVTEESHDEGLVEYPHFTRPPSFRGLDVPQVLLSGHHAQIARWRHEQSLRRTIRFRPDLIELSNLSESDQKIVADELGQASSQLPAS